MDQSEVAERHRSEGGMTVRPKCLPPGFETAHNPLKIAETDLLRILRREPPALRSA